MSVPLELTMPRTEPRESATRYWIVPVARLTCSIGVLLPAVDVGVCGVHQQPRDRAAGIPGEVVRRGGATARRRRLALAEPVAVVTRGRHVGGGVVIARELFGAVVAGADGRGAADGLLGAFTVGVVGVARRCS